MAGLIAIAYCYSHWLLSHVDDVTHHKKIGDRHDGDGNDDMVTALSTLHVLYPYLQPSVLD